MKTFQDIRPGDGPTWVGLPYVSSVPVLGDIPAHPGDGPTWGYRGHVLPRVSQYLRTPSTSRGCPTWGYYVSSVPALGDIPAHPGDGPTWGYPMCPMSRVSQYTWGHPSTSRGMVPRGATLCVLCLECPSTWGHPSTSRGWSHVGLPYVSYVSSVPVLGDIPAHPGDGPTWGYPMCPMSRVSQYLGTSQHIPGMVPRGATLGVLCLECPST